MLAEDSELLLLAKKLGRHAWKMVWVLMGIQVLATAAGVASLKFIPKQYRSSTTIRLEKSQMINPLTRGLAVSSEMEERVRSLSEEILSRDYFEKVITRLGLEKRGSTPAQREARLRQMIKNTQISNKGGREVDTFQITYVGDDPEEVRDITNLLSGVFIENSLANKSDEAGTAVEFLQAQLQIYRKRLEESEAALRQFEERHVDQVPATRAAQLARVEQLRGNLTEVQNSLRQARMKQEMLRPRVTGTAGAPGSAGEAMHVPNPVQAQIREKEAHLRRLLVEYSANYPDVVALRTEIEQLQAEFAAHPTVPAAQAVAPGGANQGQVQEALTYVQLQQLEVDMGTLTAREGQLQQELARYEKKVQGIPQVEQELSRLKRDYDVNNDIYNNFLRRLEEARVSKDLNAMKKGEVFRILEAAALPVSPIRPVPFRMLLMGVGAGLALNLALVYLLALQDTSFQGASEVKAVLGVKVFAGIPRYWSAKQRKAAQIKSLGLGVAFLAYSGGIAAFLFWARVRALLHGGH